MRTKFDSDLPPAQIAYILTRSVGLDPCLYMGSVGFS